MKSQVQQINIKKRSHMSKQATLPQKYRSLLGTDSVIVQEK